MTVAGIGHSRVRKKDQSKIRSNSVQQVLQKTDRILGQHDVRVVFKDSTIPAPAYTDGKTITVNTSWDPAKESIKKGFTTKSMLMVTALNYHELAHTMFMPRIDSKLVMDIRNKGAFSTYNILQDQADETKFVKLYDPSRNYFTSLVTGYMLESDEHLANNYLLVSGRLFIPKRLRDLLADRFSKPKLIPDIDALVARYKQLLYPGDQSEMYKVTLELHKLISDIADSTSGVGTVHTEITEGEVQASKAKEISRYSDEYEDEEDDEEGPTEADDEEAEAEDQEGDEEDEAQGSDPESSDAEEDSEQGDDSSGDGSGRGDEEDFKDALEEAFNEAFDEVEQEVEDRIESVRDHESDYTVEADQGHRTNHSPEPKLIQTVARCVDEFREVSEQHSPGWHTNQRHGKLNHRQYARALQGSEHVYRRWYEGINDALDFEVVFLLDLSYSMSGRQITEASKSLWVLKRTFEELDGLVTVLGFHNYVYLLSQRGDRAKTDVLPIYQTGGGTVVHPAIDEATRILSISQKPLRLCVIITDGDFNDGTEATKAMAEVGNPISIVGINHNVDRYSDKENVVHTQTIKDATELVDVVKNLALRLSDERLNRRS